MNKGWIILLGLLLFAGIWMVSAQDETCELLPNDVLLTASEMCQNIAVDTVCIGAGAVSIGAANAAAGDVVELTDIDTIRSGEFSDDGAESGITLINAQMGLEDTALRVILFGDAQLTNATQAAVDLIEMPLVNTAGYTVNLRGGPGTNHAVVGTLDEDVEVVVDGRSEDSQWFRIGTAEGVAWIHTSLVSIDGDIEQLAVLESSFTAPLQSMQLETDVADREVCGLAASGLLLELNSENTLQLQMNGVELRFGRAILMATADDESGLMIRVIDGNVEVRTQDGALDVGGGESVSVRLDESLMVASAPQDNGLYDFSDVAGAPLALLSVDEMVCVAGLSILDEQVSAFGGPGDDFPLVTEVDASGHYIVLGYASDDNARNWWQIESSGGYQSWVLQDRVRTAGMCNNIAEVEAPTDVTAGTNSSPATNVSFLPAEQSVWQAASGQDVMTGSCENEQPMAVCNHLVALIPNGDGSLLWRGQEPTPYLMTQTGTNTYVHQGRNYQNTGNISMQMTLTSEGTWQMTWTTIFDDNPACNHTFYYTASRQW